MKLFDFETSDGVAATLAHLNPGALRPTHCFRSTYVSDYGRGGGGGGGAH